MTFSLLVFDKSSSVITMKPYIKENGSTPFSYVMVSELEHQEDHQIIADAMAAQLG